MSESDLTPAVTRVLYNGDCPVCRAEISHYADYTRRLRLPVEFDDIARTDLSQWGLDADQATRRLHVRNASGEIVSGLPAFRALWVRMPRYRWLARVTGWPLVRPAAATLYDRVLAPFLYHRHRIRFARAEKTGNADRAT